VKANKKKKKRKFVKQTLLYFGIEKKYTFSLLYIDNFYEK